jgi:hypothetical protein
MRCPQCASYVEPGQKFCAVCGSALAASSEEPKPVAGARVLGEPAPDDFEDLRFPARPSPLTPGYSSKYGPRSGAGEGAPEADDYSAYVSSSEGTASARVSRAVLLLTVGVALLAIIGTIIAAVLSVSAPTSIGPLNAPVEAPAAAAANPTSTTTPLAASDLLDLAARAMDGVTTLHYQTEVGFYGVQPMSPGVTGTGVLSVTLAGDVRRPDSYTMSADVSQIGQYIVISGTTWSRRDNAPGWSRHSTVDLSLGPVNPLAIPSYLRNYKSGTAREIDAENTENGLLHHVRFDVDVAKVAAEGLDASLKRLTSTSNIAADAWIRDGDYLLDRLSLAIEIGGGEGAIVRTALSGYNSAIDIKAPDGSSP